MKPGDADPEQPYAAGGVDRVEQRLGDLGDDVDPVGRADAASGRG